MTAHLSLLMQSLAEPVSPVSSDAGSWSVTTHLSPLMQSLSAPRRTFKTYGASSTAALLGLGRGEELRESEATALTLLQPLGVREPVELPLTEVLTEPQEVGEALALSVEDMVVVMEELREAVREPLPEPQPEGVMLLEPEWLPLPLPLLEPDLL